MAPPPLESGQLWRRGEEKRRWTRSPFSSRFFRRRAPKIPPETPVRHVGSSGGIDGSRETRHPRRADSRCVSAGSPKHVGQRCGRAPLAAGRRSGVLVPGANEPRTSPAPGVKIHADRRRAALPRRANSAQQSAGKRPFRSTRPPASLLLCHSRRPPARHFRWKGARADATLMNGLLNVGASRRDSLYFRRGGPSLRTIRAALHVARRGR